MELKAYKIVNSTVLFLAVALIFLIVFDRRTLEVTGMRSVIFHISVFIVPLIIGAAFLEWLRTIRPGLPSWRNGLALASMVAVFFAWFFLAALFVSASSRSGFMKFLSPDWILMLDLAIVFAILLAMALKDGPRLQVIAAALLVLSGVVTTVYI